MSGILDFYRGSGRDNVGRTLDEILSMKDDALEISHDWVQWIFPTTQLSNFNEDAPIPSQDELVVMRNDLLIQQNLTRSYVRFLSFLGLRHEQEVGVVPGENFEERRKLVWGGFNHNYLRVTRLLDHLNVIGRNFKSQCVFRALRELSRTGSIVVSENTAAHWAKTQA